jgi:L-malate glycosyltransferase
VLRVLHVIDSLQLGGTEWQCLSLATYINTPRFRSHLVCFKGGGPLLEMLRGRGLSLEVVPFPGFRRPGFVKSLMQLAAFMRQHRIQIVQAYGFYSNVPALLSGWISRVPILIASRRDMGEFLNGVNRFVEKNIFKLADRIVVNAEAIRHELLEAGQVSAEKIIVIPTGVDLDRFTQLMPSGGQPAWAGKGKVVAMVARFGRQKDQATFLYAAKQLLTADPTIVFVLAGDGYLKEAAEQLSREMGISSSVWFVGAMDPSAMPVFLRHVDVSVLASKGNEGIPNAILESMAAGKPVVATDTGGCREAVRDAVTGFLVPPGNPEQLAEKILRLLRDEREADQMGKAGRERVVAEFSLSQMTRRFSSLYESLAVEKLGQAAEVR